MFDRFAQILVGSAMAGMAIAGIARPAQAGPQCLPYVTDSGQIVVICRKPVTTAATDSRGQFPRDLARRHPV